MQKVDNENKEKKLQEKRNAQAEADKSNTIRRYFGPINKNKRLDSFPHKKSNHLIQIQAANDLSQSKT